jgi:hypothetical protein
MNHRATALPPMHMVDRGNLIDARCLVPMPAGAKERMAALLRPTVTLAAISGDLQTLRRVLRQTSAPPPNRYCATR